LDKTGKVFEGTVVGPLRFTGKDAPRQLAAPEVILDAITAYPLAGAGIVRACAQAQALFLFAFHGNSRLALIPINCNPIITPDDSSLPQKPHCPFPGNKAEDFGQITVPIILHRKVFIIYIDVLIP